VLGSLAPEAGKTGVIHRLSVAPANAHELSVLPEPVERTSGIVAGDRNYHSPKTKEELASMTVELFGSLLLQEKRSQPQKERSLLSRFRYRIDTPSFRSSPSVTP
jgi:hypothetical protein